MWKMGGQNGSILGQKVKTLTQQNTSSTIPQSHHHHHIPLPSQSPIPLTHIFVSSSIYPSFLALFAFLFLFFSLTKSLMLHLCLHRYVYLGLFDTEIEAARYIFLSYYWLCTQNNVPFLVCQQTQHCIHFTEVHCILLFKVEDLFGRNLLLPVDR